jgi:hypothetical protein
MHFTNQTCSHKNNLHDITTAMNQHTTTGVLLETVFPTVVVPRSYKRDKVRTKFRWKGAAIQRGLEHRSRGTAIAGTVTMQLLVKTLQAGKS